MTLLSSSNAFLEFVSDLPRGDIIATFYPLAGRECTVNYHRKIVLVYSGGKGVQRGLVKRRTTIATVSQGKGGLFSDDCSYALHL